MRALVTGGAGFIGRRLCAAFCERGYEVRSFDAEPARERDPRIEDIQGDIADAAQVARSMEGVDLVAHLAAKHRFFGVSPAEFQRVNVQGTATLLDAAGRVGIRRFFFMSSVAIYGDSSTPTIEETRAVPTGPYGATKLEAERLVAAWASQRPDRVVRVVRPTVVYGPGNRGNVFRLMRQIRSGFFVPVGRGENVKSIAYVENLIDACLFALDREESGLSVYNYSDEPHLPFATIVATICRLLGKPEPRFSIPLGPALAILGPAEMLARAVGWQLPVHAAALKMNKSTRHESGKIRAEGFRQRVPTEEGLARMAAWFLHRGADDPAASGGEGGE